MLTFLSFGLLLALTNGTGSVPVAPPAPSPSGPQILLVVGAPGEETYGTQFQEWADAWTKVCKIAGARLTIIGQTQREGTNDLDRIQKFLEAEPKAGTEELWLVFIGHGTFDGKVAKFNLTGPDLSSGQLAEWMKEFTRPQIIINTASASGPFLAALSRTNRVVITATRSGYELNFARFGQYFSGAMNDPAADIDKDGQTSLLEAFLTASRLVMEFYETEGRLATEHALLDDTGDGLGTPADWFRGVRAVKKAKDGASADGFRAHQIHLIQSEEEQKLPPEVKARRNELELEVAHLREKKDELPEEIYYEKLEALLVQIAELYRGLQASPSSTRRGGSPSH